MATLLELVGGTDTLRSLGVEELADRLGGALDALRVAEEAAGDSLTRLRATERETEGLRAEIRRYAAWVDDMERDAHAAYLRHTATEEALGVAQLALTAPKVEFHQHDFIPGFAAFRPDATTPGPDSRAFCVLNLGSLLAAVNLGDVSASDIPYAIAESMMHEIMHVLEQWAGVDFSEERIEALIAKYRAHAAESADV